jgi:hypothetical protein
MSIKEFVISMLSDERGSMSHKRILSTIGAFILFGVYIATKSDKLGELIFYMVMAFAGLTTIDKFTK